ncbi:P-loop containing nucleoside triphosphate hydrolase protein [Nemania sp. FL0031]|nr:P-loop containing nucleoside triphosphate hydrolase protein [Nemania sp. FL0031]
MAFQLSITLTPYILNEVSRDNLASTSLSASEELSNADTRHHIKRFSTDQSPVLTNARTLSSPSVYILPKQPARFYGRVEEVQSIQQSIDKNPSVTIRGIAGVGKSSIALRFAHQSKSQYSVIIWMRCEPKTALDHSCQEALRRLGVIGKAEKPGAEMRQKWRDYLAQAGFQWLVIFDNVEDAEDLNQYWPQDSSGKVIVTTRNPELGFQLTGDQIDIHPFSPEEGRKCVLSLTSWPGGVSSDPASAEELSNELGGLPIGIVQMVALMRKRKTPIKRFLEDYRQNKSAYHDKEVVSMTGIYPEIKPTIGSNWTMSFDSLQDRSKSLLGILSLLSPDSIPQELFNHWDGPQNQPTSGLPACCNDVDSFFDIQEELIGLALIEKDPNTGNMSLHRLEQVQFEHYLDLPSRQRAFEVAAKLLYDAFPNEQTGQRFTGTWDDCATYIQHAIVLNSHYLTRSSSPFQYLAPPEFTKLMAWCSWYLWEIADYSSFAKVLEGGKKACKSSPSDAFDDASWSLLNYNAGTVETSMGLFGPAENSLNEALKVRRKLGNKDDISATLNNLGLLYNSMHKFDLAEKHYSEALEIHLSRQDSVDRNLSLRMVKHNIQRNAIQSGENLPPLSELQETADFFRASISWWMEGHAYLVLGNLYLKLERYDDASDAYTAARDTLSREGRASKQPATAMVLYKLGYLAYQKSQFSEAVEILHKSTAISELYPAIPVEQARTQFMLAKALRQARHPRAAEEAEKKVKALMKQYCMSIGSQQVVTCSDIGDFSKFITAKYQ